MGNEFKTRVHLLWKVSFKSRSCLSLSTAKLRKWPGKHYFACSINLHVTHRIKKKLVLRLLDMTRQLKMTCGVIVFGWCNLINVPLYVPQMIFKSHDIRKVNDLQEKYLCTSTYIVWYIDLFAYRPIPGKRHHTKQFT